MVIAIILITAFIVSILAMLKVASMADNHAEIMRDSKEEK